MSKSILHQLYYGDLSPSQTITPPNPQYEEAQTKASKLLFQLHKELSNKQFQLLERYLEYRSDYYCPRRLRKHSGWGHRWHSKYKTEMFPTSEASLFLFAGGMRMIRISTWSDVQSLKPDNDPALYLLLSNRFKQLHQIFCSNGSVPL